ncbi:hypothetical protein [Ensifer adhaerens]|uniref:Uncharacterized protein n=1 Tax=Ensifer adhaerens TaxID=106592 RepID=A0A9Q8YEC8_ENSAD|nr:hypothetical protein [Ensifer adhaerens]USJ27347.1 hypothetical protein NE863_33340 [Ensifer adhaerens]UTV41063.1 hypothetical protein MYG64_28205 [Ensifer adhaerens]
MFQVLTRITTAGGVSRDLSIRPAAMLTRHIVHLAPLVAILVFAIALPVLVARLLGQRDAAKGASSSGMVFPWHRERPAVRGALRQNESDQ